SAPTINCRYFHLTAPPASSIATNADAPAATRTMAFCTRPPETSDLPLGHRCAPYGHVASLQVTRLVVQAEALPSPPRDSVLVLLARKKRTVSRGSDRHASPTSNIGNAWPSRRVVVWPYAVHGRGL